MRRPDSARKSPRYSFRKQLGQSSKLGKSLYPQFEALEARLVLASLPTGFTETSVASGFSSPTAMEFSPIGELWVIQQGGAVKLVRSGLPVLTVTTISVNSVGERGLLGIAFDANYDGAGPNTDYIYFYYTSPSTGGGDLPNNRIARYTVTGAGTSSPTLGSAAILRDLPPNTEDSDSNHNGGALHFGPDGKLYAAVGDHHYTGVSGGSHVSQINSSPFGKILRLNPDGTNPGDNPFDNQVPGSWEGAIWAKGLRNPYTFSFSTDGTMFINDVGEGSWEEINLGERGANYGWSGTSTLIEGFQSTPPAWTTNYRNPIMAYDHGGNDGSPPGVAITGGAFYPSNGPFGANYSGKYFFSDYGADFIRVFDPADPGQSTVPGVTAGDEDTSSDFASSVASHVDLKVANGSLYYLARGGGGAVFRVSFNGSYGPTQVVSRSTFYNQSAFDGDSAAIDAADDNAIDNKTAYLPGTGDATAASVTSYTRGINGIMVDLAGNHGPLSLSDFTFKMSGALLAANNSPSTWTPAPAPTGFAVRPGAGAGGSDRVEFTWADGAIKDRWLEVVVEGNDAAGGSNTNTGLAASDVFFFGNKVGATFIDSQSGFFKSDSGDQIATRFNQGIASSVANVFDFNKDFSVDALDEIAARFNSGFLTAINISDPPADSDSAVASALAVRASNDAPPATSNPDLPTTSSTLSDGPKARLLAHELEAAAPIRRAILAAIEETPELDDDLLDALLADSGGG